MKKKFIVSAAAALILGSSCAQARTENGTEGRKILIAYFSQSGNTRAVAEQIKALTGGDLFEIEPDETYPSDYDALVDQAKKEIDANYKPAIKANVENIGDYDVIFIGSPCWWATIAPPVASFLAANDLSGKTVVPFITHAGSRMGRSEDDIRKLCPQSTVLKGFPVLGKQAGEADDRVGEWLRELKLDK